MRCPYPDCGKDYNDSQWPRIFATWLSPEGDGSIIQRQTLNRLYVITRRCRFCQQYFHEVYVGHENFKGPQHRFEEMEPTLEPLVSYPVSKTRFEAKEIPKAVLDALHEAERCRSVGSLTGVGACLRKTVYSVCDDKEAEGRDYREKIVALPVKETYKELLKQIKWLGDNTTKPGEEKYTMDMVDVALEILPIVIDDLYLKDEKIDQAAKLLAKARSVNVDKDEPGQPQPAESAQAQGDNA